MNNKQIKEHLKKILPSAKLPTRIPYPGDCHRWSAKAVCCPFGIQDTDVPVSHGGDNKAKND